MLGLVAMAAIVYIQLPSCLTGHTISFQCCLLFQGIRSCIT